MEAEVFHDVYAFTEIRFLIWNYFHTFQLSPNRTRLKNFNPRLRDFSIDLDTLMLMHAYYCQKSDISDADKYLK